MLLYGEHCLQVSLKMILGILEPEKEYDLKELEAITHKGPGGTFASHYLMWLSKRGFDVVRVSSFDWEAFRDKGVDYFAELGKDQLAYNSHSNLDYERSVINDFLASVPTLRRRPTVSDIKTAFEEEWQVRVSIDAGVLDPTKTGYFGHSVVALAVEGGDIVFHDPGLPGRAYRREPTEAFQRAMGSFGGTIGGAIDLIRPRANKS